MEILFYNQTNQIIKKKLGNGHDCGRRNRYRLAIPENLTNRNDLKSCYRGSRLYVGFPEDIKCIEQR